MIRGGNVMHLPPDLGVPINNLDSGIGVPNPHYGKIPPRSVTPITHPVTGPVSQPISVIPTPLPRVGGQPVDSPPRGILPIARKPPAATSPVSSTPNPSNPSNPTPPKRCTMIRMRCNNCVGYDSCGNCITCNDPAIAGGLPPSINPPNAPTPTPSQNNNPSNDNSSNGYSGAPVGFSYIPTSTPSVSSSSPSPVLIIIGILAIMGAGGWYVYHRYIKKDDKGK